MKFVNSTDEVNEVVNEVLHLERSVTHYEVLF